MNLDDDVLAWELGPDGWGRVPAERGLETHTYLQQHGGEVGEVTATLEREVKLAASPAFRMPSLDELGDDVLTIPRDPERLQTVYFDTQDFRLARWGVSLRHREGQGWTTKLPTDDARGDLLVRGEFTFPGEDASNPPDEAVALIRAYVRSAPLRPVARLRTIRRMIQLLDLDDRLLGEVVDDEVSVLSGRRIAARFRELEVEITDDTPAGLLDEVLDRLRTAGAGAPDPTPKYVRAVGPLATQAPEIEVAPLRSHATVSQVLGRALSMSVVQLLRHDAVVRLDADPEGVHLTRVASRRLRSDLRTFRSKVDHEWAEPLREELRWLGTVLGEARDADVLLARLAGRSEMIPAAEAPGVAQVIEALEQRRKEAHTSMIGSINGERYVALLDRLVEAAQAPVVLPGRGRARPGHRGRSARGPVASSARGREAGRQASGRRGAPHRPHPGEARALRRRRGRSHPREVRPPVRRRGGGPPDDPGGAQRCGGRRVLAADRGRPCDARGMRRSRPACWPASSAPPPTTRASGGARRGSAWSSRGRRCDEGDGETEGRARGGRARVADGRWG